MDDNKLVVLGGPSGAGKTTVASRLTRCFGAFYDRVVTTTTRLPRPEEKDGVDYHFLSQRQFDTLVASGAFLEHSKVLGKSYGTLKEDVDVVLLRGVAPLLNIDVSGMQEVRRCGEIPIISVFISPPNLEVLAQRLRARAKVDGTPDDEVRRRLMAAEELMPYASEYDHFVVNDTLAEAVLEVHKILLQQKT